MSKHSQPAQPGDGISSEAHAQTSGSQGAADRAHPSSAAATQEELESLRAERDEYLGQWKRAQADYQNLRRRNQSDFENALRLAQKGLLSELLLVLDCLQMALASPATSAEARNLATGVKLTQDRLLAALDAAEVRALPEGGQFDPGLHEAVQQVPDAGPPGRIVETVRRGYTWRGVVLRPAQVRIAAGPAEPATEPDPPDQPKRDESPDSPGPG